MWCYDCPTPHSICDHPACGMCKEHRDRPGGATCLCAATGEPHREGECHWWDAARVHWPDMGASYLWFVTVTVDEDGVAWTWCGA